jgi:DNA-binding beta-propeller fold protein YncE
VESAGQAGGGFTQSLNSAVDTAAIAGGLSGQYLYATRVAAAGSGIFGFSITASNGSLTALNSGTPYTSGTIDGDIAVTPNGKYLYGTNTGDSTLCGFSINSSTGALVYLGNEVCKDVSQNPTALGVAIDPTGKFIFMVHTSLNQVFAYSINDSTGALTAISGSPFSVGTTPYQVTVIGITQ